MAITFLKVKVINPERPKKTRECESLVDSGAVYSVVPQNVLKGLGIKPISFQEFILANKKSHWKSSLLIENGF